MMGIGFSELMIILVIIMIIFGAGKLPQIGSAFGKSIRNFKTSMKEAEEMDKVEEAAATDAVPAPSAASQGTLAAAEVNPAGAVQASEASAAAPASPAPTAGSTPAKRPAATSPSPSVAESPKKPPQPQQKKEKGKADEKSFEEELIEQAIKELKDKRVGTIRTQHDGLVQQNDVFTKSVDRTPWHMKGRDRGVKRDLL
ncbi:MAG: twin-arginine translocase TatA/TatE family subunit [Nitrospinaceae bacterium]